MDCKEVRRRLSDYVKGKLDDDLRSRIDAHLATCEDCRKDQQVAKLMETFPGVFAQALSGSVDDPPIIRIVHTIIQQAIRDGASETRLQPSTDGLHLTMCVDGTDREVMVLPNYVAAHVVARLKTMAGLNVEEHQIAQEGAMPIMWETKRYDAHLSVRPGELGESILMRIDAAPFSEP